MREISSGNDFIEYAEKFAQDRVYKAIMNYAEFFEKVKCGEKRISYDSLEFLVDRYNSALKIFVGKEEGFYDEYKYQIIGGLPYGPNIHKDKTIK